MLVEAVGVYDYYVSEELETTLTLYEKPITAAGVTKSPF